MGSQKAKGRSQVVFRIRVAPKIRQEILEYSQPPPTGVDKDECREDEDGESGREVPLPSRQAVQDDDSSSGRKKWSWRLWRKKRGILRHPKVRQQVDCLCDLLISEQMALKLSKPEAEGRRLKVNVQPKAVEMALKGLTNITDDDAVSVDLFENSSLKSYGMSDTSSIRSRISQLTTSTSRSIPLASYLSKSMSMQTTQLQPVGEEEDEQAYNKKDLSTSNENPQEEQARPETVAINGPSELDRRTSAVREFDTSQTSAVETTDANSILEISEAEYLNSLADIAKGEMKHDTWNGSEQQTQSPSDKPYNDETSTQLDIVPLFGYCSQLLGQVYVVSMSAVKEGFEDAVNMALETPQPRQRRPGASKSKATGKSRCGHSDEGKQNLNKSRKGKRPDVPFSNRYGSTEETFLNQLEMIAPDEVVPFLGLLRKIGEAFYVDPLSVDELVNPIDQNSQVVDSLREEIRRESAAANTLESQGKKTSTWF